MNIEKNKNNNNYKNDLQSLQNKLKEKDEEIKQLKLKLQNIGKTNEKKFIPAEEIMCVFFSSMDQKVNFAIPCASNEIFAEVEEKLYKEYPEYRETNNYFIANGAQVLRFKTIGENKIGNGRPVTLIVPSNEEK